MQTQTIPVSMLPAHTRVRPLTALVASADGSFRQRVVQILTGLRWQVREAGGGAQAWAEAGNALPEAVIVDSWLPDLELNEFLKDFRAAFPQVDLVAAGGGVSGLESPRGPYRQELLYALRHSQDGVPADGLSSVGWKDGVPADGLSSVGWKDGVPADGLSSVGWKDGVPADGLSSVGWKDGVPADGLSSVGWKDGVPADGLSSVGWKDGVPADGLSSVGWKDGVPADGLSSVGWKDGVPADGLSSVGWKDGVPADGLSSVGWKDGVPADGLSSVGWKDGVPADGLSSVGWKDGVPADGFSSAGWKDGDTAVWNAAPILARAGGDPAPAMPASPAMPPGMPAAASLPPVTGLPAEPRTNPAKTIPIRAERSGAMAAADRLPELVGIAPCMLEVSRRVRLVAPRTTPVLIEGPTGSGKELVAEALHRLSVRSRKPFIAINCAAIPEALLEAELFGHTRGAFTGAVQGRVGRIEAADGGTLFLDEIGEMPLALQAKLLRFVECGELQRVGDNDTVRVDVRIVAATHRQLAQQAASGGFRSDLYYRLAVFLIRTPALADHAQDVPLLVEHFLDRLGREAPMKRLDFAALAKLAAHDWPGNVRELEHVLERAVILAGDAPVLTGEEIDFGLAVN